MTLINEYRRQYAWRDWPSVYKLLPTLIGSNVLDLGCAVGDNTADLVARGANVIGVDLNEELLSAARSRKLTNAQFIAADLRVPLELPGGWIAVDGIWSSFVAAYFVDLPAVLSVWAKHLRSGGWMALVETDDLFAHEPISPRTRELLESYVQDSLGAGRYDFRMGRKLSAYLKAAGFVVREVRIVDDQEFSTGGPASPDVLEGWQRRLDRMKLLQAHCGDEFAAIREDFLAALSTPEHHSAAQVYACVAAKL